MVKRLSFLGVIARVFMWAFLLGLAVIVLYPLLWMVLNGFKTNAELFGNPFALPVDWSFTNYQKAWNRGVSDYLTTSVLVTVTSTIVTVFVSAWAAYGLTRVTIPFNKAITALILGGLMLAPTVALVPLVKMFQAMGLYNSFWALLILYTAFRVPFTHVPHPRLHDRPSARGRRGRGDGRRGPVDGLLADHPAHEQADHHLDGPAARAVRLERVSLRDGVHQRQRRADSSPWA
ncbi:hypothetical protein GCM10020219_055800 [Nonomuraea dietziae]